MRTGLRDDSSRRDRRLGPGIAPDSSRSCRRRSSLPPYVSSHSQEFCVGGIQLYQPSVMGICLLFRPAVGDADGRGVGCYVDIVTSCTVAVTVANRKLSPASATTKEVHTVRYTKYLCVYRHGWRLLSRLHLSSGPMLPFTPWLLAAWQRLK
jgi:hypothetical protein